MSKRLTAKNASSEHASSEGNRGKKLIRCFGRIGKKEKIENKEIHLGGRTGPLSKEKFQDDKNARSDVDVDAPLLSSRRPACRVPSSLRSRYSRLSLILVWQWPLICHCTGESWWPKTTTPLISLNILWIMVLEFLILILISTKISKLKEINKQIFLILNRFFFVCGLWTPVRKLDRLSSAAKFLIR